MQPRQQQETTQRRPNDELDLMSDVANATVDDDFLQRQNLGVGNYSNKEMYQQVKSFRAGVFSDSAFARLLHDRAIKETQTGLAKEGWSYLAPNKDEPTVVTYDGWSEQSEQKRREIWVEQLDGEGETMSRSKWLDRRGKQIFEELIKSRDIETGRSPAREAMNELAGWDGNWTPPHYRMLEARHETSRSRGARLMDNVFQRVKKHIESADKDGRRL